MKKQVTKLVPRASESVSTKPAERYTLEQLLAECDSEAPLGDSREAQERIHALLLLEHRSIRASTRSAFQMILERWPVSLNFGSRFAF